MGKPLATIVGPGQVPLQVADILGRLGFQVQMLETGSDIEEGSSDLLVVGSGQEECLSLLLERREGEGFVRENLPLPLDVDDLLGRLKRCPLACPRRHLRIALSLPAVLSHDGTSVIAEISSLGTGGAFVRTSLQRIDRGEKLELVIPLLGMQVELELESHVLYRVQPEEENSYVQGIGVRFITPSGDSVRLLEAFISRSLQMEGASGKVTGAPSSKSLAAGHSVRSWCAGGLQLRH